jgi:hypothetical protein
MNFTRLDFNNARLYALQHLFLHEFNKFKTSHPHVFDHVLFSQRQANSEKDFYVPPKLGPQCFIVSIKFNETGCRKIACFPYKEGGKVCEPSDNPRFVKRGENGYTLACQPACFHLLSVKRYLLDTEFRKGQCSLRETFDNRPSAIPKDVSSIVTWGITQAAAAPQPFQRWRETGELEKVADELAIDLGVRVSPFSISHLLRDTVPEGLSLQVSTLTAIAKFKMPLLRAMENVGRDSVVNLTEKDLEPESIMALLETRLDSKAALLLEDKIREYLNALDDKSFEERLVVQERLYYARKTKSVVARQVALAGMCLFLCLIVPFFKRAMEFYLCFLIIYALFPSLNEKFAFF